MAIFVRDRQKISPNDIKRLLGIFSENEEYTVDLLIRKFGNGRKLLAIIDFIWRYHKGMKKVKQKELWINFYKEIRNKIDGDIIIILKDKKGEKFERTLAYWVWLILTTHDRKLYKKRLKRYSNRIIVQVKYIPITPK